jgi:hypothetical protein
MKFGTAIAARIPPKKMKKVLTTPMFIDYFERKPISI